MEDIRVADGKYTICLPTEQGETLRALRYGEEWRDLTGDNMVMALASELSEARKEIERLRRDANAADARAGHLREQLEDLQRCVEWGDT